MSMKTGKNIEWRKSKKYITLVTSIIFLTMFIINIFNPIFHERIVIFQFIVGALSFFVYLRLLLIPKIRILEDKLEIATSHFRTKTLLPNEIVNIGYTDNEIIITTSSDNEIIIAKKDIESSNLETINQDLNNFKDKWIH